ncbi:MAG: hypothetical protein [Podoviridae sp. ctrTa16]|nr:MAG: hypothetical protein [Podoviridae sp. ctrTa16]
MTHIYELISENLSNLGGRMGTESTFNNFSKPFSTIEKAKDYAVADYGNAINWSRTKRGLCSGDLMYVMYYINKVEIDQQFKK